MEPRRAGDWAVVSCGAAVWMSDGLISDARVGLAAAISPNERLQVLYHPWTSYVIVPLFVLHLRPLPLAPGRAAGPRSRAVAGAP